MTDPEAAPPHGIPVEEQARSERALVRPGPHVAIPEPRETVLLPADFAVLLESAEDLRRECGCPRYTHDAAWAHLRPPLIRHLHRLAAQSESAALAKRICELLLGSREL